MSILQRISRWLGLEWHATSTQPQSGAIRRLLEAGQYAKRVEDWDRALDQLGEAQLLAERAGDTTALAVINLHRAEVFIQQKRWADAQNLLLQMRRQAQETSQRTQMSYTLTTLGTLAQAQGDWEEARAYYEQALKVARAAASLGSEGRALGYMADTYLHEQNASYAVHLLREALPKLNASGDIEFSSYFVGQLGRGLILTGQTAEGEQLLRRALELAIQMRYVRFERRWALAVAERDVVHRRYQEAYSHYREALKLFETAGPDTVTDQARALCQLSRVCRALHLYDEALDYAEQARALPVEDAEVVRLMQGVRGMALRVRGSSAEAVTCLEQASAAYEAVGDIDSLYLEILRNLAAAQADTGAVEVARTLYAQAISGAARLEDPSELAQAHVERGLLLMQQGDMPGAIEDWTAALGIYEAENQPAQVARLHCDIARLRKYLGQGRRALRDYDQALMTLNAVEDWRTRGIVLANAAVAYTDHGEVETAEAFFSEAIEIAHRLGDRPAEATRRGNQGWFLLVTGKPRQAITVLEHAVRMSHEEGLPLQVAVQTDNIALAHRELGNLAAARTYHEQALELIHQVQNDHWQSVIEINLANTLIVADQWEEAGPLLQDALTRGRASQNIEIIIGALVAQADVHIHAETPAAAAPLLAEAVELARRAEMRRLLARALVVTSRQAAAQGDYERAQSAWTEAQHLFTILHMPHKEPDWLAHLPVEN